MPHLIVEYSANVDADRGGPIAIDDLLAALHDAALDSGVAAPDALRTRGACRDRYVIADGHPDNGFVAVTVRLGAGRTVAERHGLATALMDALDAALGDARRTMMLSVECREIDPDTRINRNHLRSLVAERAASDDRTDREEPTWPPT